MEMQIWNNAVFDDGGSSGRRDLKLSSSSAWHGFRPLAAIPPAESFSGAGKENRNPGSPLPKNQNAIEDVDAEIEKIESEIERLQSRLQELRLKKRDMDSRASVKRGRVVASKFLDMKPSPRKSMAFDSPSSGRSRQRSVSLGPLEIRSAQSKRKSCIQKLQDIAEEETEAEKKEININPSPTIADSPGAPKNEEIKVDRPKLRNSSKILQPKKLFQETKKQFKREATKKAAQEKRPQKAPNVRTVSSRYSLITVKVGRNNPPEGRRKWSLPGVVDKPLPVVADGGDHEPWMAETDI